MRVETAVAFPLAEQADNHEMLQHSTHGGAMNEGATRDRAMTPEQEMWAQLIWHAVYESTGEGRSKQPCLDCHDDYFETHPERLPRVQKGKAKGEIYKPHCHRECPCGKFGHTIQQCALDFLNGPDLQGYLELAGDVNADYLRRLLGKYGLTKAILAGRHGGPKSEIVYRQQRRMVRSGNSVRL